jgi:hypothetical protein
LHVHLHGPVTPIHETSGLEERDMNWITLTLLGVFVFAFYLICIRLSSAEQKKHPKRSREMQ